MISVHSLHLCSFYIRCFWWSIQRDQTNSTTNPIQQFPNPGAEVTSMQNIIKKQESSTSSAETSSYNVPQNSDNNTATSSEFSEMLEGTSSPLESDAPRRSFPDHIQTDFGCHDFEIFGDLVPFTSSIYELDLIMWSQIKHEHFTILLLFIFVAFFFTLFL